MVDSATGNSIRVLDPPAIAGKPTRFRAATLLPNGRIIVRFHASEGAGERDRSRLFEVKRQGEPTLLGPFDLRGASTRSNVLLLGRGVDEATLMVVWPK